MRFKLTARIRIAVFNIVMACSAGHIQGVVADTQQIILYGENSNEIDYLSVALKERSKDLVNINVIDRNTYIPGSEDLIISLGLDSYIEILQKAPNNPIIGSHITSVQYRNAGLSQTSDKTIVLYKDPEISQQVRLFKAIFPKSPHLGVFLSSSTSYLEAELKKAAIKENVHLSIISFKTGEDFFKGLQQQHTLDAILALPDRAIFNRSTLKSILETTYFEDISIIGYSKGMVLAGALATTSSEEIAVVEAILEQIHIYQKSKTFSSNKHVPSNSIIINHNVARSLNLVIDENEVRASVLRDGQ